MRPRLDPDTRPVLSGAQIIKRARTDQYGNDKGRRSTDRQRPLATRNGLPEPRYRYRGTGQSLTEAEAARKLTWRETPS